MARKKGMMCIKDFCVVIFFVFMFCSGAYGGTPNNVRVTNVRGTQFTVSWTSTEEEIGQVKYGTSIENYATWATANDERGAATSDDVHHVTITGLGSNTTYYYEIISGSTIDNNSGNYYNLNPGPSLTPSGSCQPAGKVFKNQDTTQIVAYDSIVYVTILGAIEEQNSATESVLVTNDGYWFLDLVNFRTKDYSAVYSYTCGASEIFIEAQGGNDGAAEMVTQAVDFSVAQRPDMVLRQLHTVIFTAGTGGSSITGTTPQTVPHGDDCTEVTAVADNCYEFVDWSDGNTENTRTITNVTSDMNLTANFAKINYTVTFSAGTGGNLTGMANQPVACGGDCTEVTAGVDNCYEFVDWSDGSTQNPRTVTNVTSNLDFTANFAQINYTVIFSAGEGGSLTGTANQPVACGGDCTEVTAGANNCYEFVDWSDGSIENPRTITNVETNLNLTANFAKINYTVTFSAGEGGSLTGTANQPVACGGDCTEVIAIADNCYEFVDWSDGSIENTRTITNVTSNLNLTANFAKINYTQSLLVLEKEVVLPARLTSQ